MSSTSGISPLHILLGEVNLLILEIKRTPRDRWNAKEDGGNQLLEKFLTLKQLLSSADDLDSIDAKTFLLPFLDVIRADETSAIVTSLALDAVQKIISHRMLERKSRMEQAAAVNQMAEAITHARFTGSDPASDEAVLMTLINVLRELVLSPSGNLLTNEAICEIAGSLFRMALEPRLTTLLRRIADKFLMEIISHLFRRLPELKEESRASTGQVKKIHRTLKRRAPSPPFKQQQTPQPQGTTPEEPDSQELSELTLPSPVEQTANITSTAPNEDIKDSSKEAPVDGSLQTESSPDSTSHVDVPSETAKPEAAPQWSPAETMNGPLSGDEEEEPSPVELSPHSSTTNLLLPYGLAATHEIFRFIVTLISPFDKNTDINVHLGVSLLTVIFEVSAQRLALYPSIMALIRDDLCRNLVFLLQSDKLSLFTLSLRLGFFVFEIMKAHLKLQLERYLTILMEVISSDLPRHTVEHKETALDSILSFLRLPEFVMEIYVNYDCDPHCSDLFEDLTKVLSKNAFPVSGLNSINLLSLDCLLMAVEKIQRNCELVGDQPVIDDMENRRQLRNQKKIVSEAVVKFNKNPKDGLTYLQQHGILSGKSVDQLDPHQVAHFVKENHLLDKAMIGEYISKRNHTAILDAFVKSFDFTGKRIDVALREYLETFRLPGEAPLISNLLEHFASHWHDSNGKPFHNPDAAFTLSYAVIMLNTDQHNQNAKKQNVPMTTHDFKKNLSGVNRGKHPVTGVELGPDFEPELLEAIYHAIKRDEIVMPAERTGLVRDLYLWKILLRRSENVQYNPTPKPGALEAELFALLWGPTVAALSYAFDRTLDESVIRKSINGFKSCAAIAASPGVRSCEVFDNIIVTLCKFSALQNAFDSSLTFLMNFGPNTKAQLATKTVFKLARRHGHILREGWKNIVEAIAQLFRARLLPEDLSHGADFVGDRVPLIREEQPVPRQETGLFNAFYNFITADSSSRTNISVQEEIALKKICQDCVEQCEIPALVSGSKYLEESSLRFLFAALMSGMRRPEETAEASATLLGMYETCAMVCLELLVQMVIVNRDRMATLALWPNVHDSLHSMLLQEGRPELTFLTERSVVGLLRLASRFLVREEKPLRDQVLRSLRLLLSLRPAFFARVARQVCFALSEMCKSGVPANFSTKEDWQLYCGLLEWSGAGARPNLKKPDDKMDSLEDKEYLSDSESSPPGVLSPLNSGTWLMVGSEGEVLENGEAAASLSVQIEVRFHDKQAFLRAFEVLNEIIYQRHGALQLQASSAQVIVRCLSVLAECGFNGPDGIQQRVFATELKGSDIKNSRPQSHRGHDRERQHHGTKNKMTGSQPTSPREVDMQSLSDEYIEASRVILALLEILLERSLSEISVQPPLSTWNLYAKDVVRTLARSCCDKRRLVRSAALPSLQRALASLSNRETEMLSATDWQDCITRILIPLLHALKENINAAEKMAVEDTRVRAFSVLCKVFLQHLIPLKKLASFHQLWLTVLDQSVVYYKSAQSDQLREAVLESLKNVLLVMNAHGIFEEFSGPFWEATKEKVEMISPGISHQLVESTVRAATKPPEKSASVQPQMPASLPIPVPEPVSAVGTASIDDSAVGEDLTAIVKLEELRSPITQNDPTGIPLLLDSAVITGVTFVPVISPRGSSGSLVNSVVTPVQETSVSQSPSSSGTV